MAAYRISSQL